MNTKRYTAAAADSVSGRFRRRIRWAPLTFLAVLVLALTGPVRAQTLPLAIPFSDVGARATADYHGAALAVTPTADGARLQCGFHKLNGHATPEGLWLESTKPGGGHLRLMATAVGRGGSRARQCTLTEAASSVRSALCIVTVPQGNQVPLGVPCPHKVASVFDRPFLTEQETTFSPFPFYKPAVPNGAIADLRQGAETLARTGKVSVEDKLVRFARPSLTEEYSVRVNGLQQDFIIPKPPEGAGDLTVELALSGARAEGAACGARLRLDGSGRTLAYGRLRAEDATGRELTARLEVVSADRLVASVADANATYPVRIDPTFSDADWVSLNPGMPGANGTVSAMAVDNSGNVYIGGDFTFIGTVPANGVAKWDGSAWVALGSGIGGSAPHVNALVVSGTDLYAGGEFTTAGGVAAHRIAKWDGSAWSALGSGMDAVNGAVARVSVLAVSGTDLYAGGYFTYAGGVIATNIAKWTGSAWSALGSGMNGDVLALAVRGTSLYAGGSFTTAGGVPANYLAKWDGTAWSALGSGMNTPGCVYALAVNGTDLYAGGDFRISGGATATNIAKWNGSAWSDLGSGMNNRVLGLAVSGTDLYAGGSFTGAGALPANHIAKWNGSGWSAMGSGMIGFSALAVSGTNVYAGGSFSTTSGSPAQGVAAWTNGTWSALGQVQGMNDFVCTLAVKETNLYVGGCFTTAGGVVANGIAKWNGSAWSELGSGMSSPRVYALAVSGTDLYAGGQFTTAGGVTVNNIAKWNGSTWSALGSGMNSYGAVRALAVCGTDLYAAGSFTTAGGVPANFVAKWDGNAWSAMGTGLGPRPDGFSPEVRALAALGTDVYVGGDFSTAGGVRANGIAKWSSGTWSALGSGMGGSWPIVNTLLLSGTDLYAGGSFTMAGGMPADSIAKWDGSTWSALSSGLGGANPFVYALAVSGPYLYAGGQFTTAGGQPAHYIAKWDGSGWSGLGSGISGYFPQSGTEVNALAADGAGHLFVAGSFYLAGTNVSVHVAQADVASVPAIVMGPRNQTAETGSTVRFAVGVTGGDLTYLLFFNGTNLLNWGADTCLELTNVNSSQAGTYTVVITNVLGTATSPPAPLNVIASVERRPVPGVKVRAEAGSLLYVDYTDSLRLTPQWSPLGSVSLTSKPQYYFDLTLPLPPQRFYRAWQAGTPSVMPALDLHFIPAITLTGNMGGSVRVDYINRYGPIDAWVTLETVSLISTSQLYFDTSAPGQPERLYRLVPLP